MKRAGNADLKHRTEQGSKQSRTLAFTEKENDTDNNPFSPQQFEGMNSSAVLNEIGARPYSSSQHSSSRQDSGCASKEIGKEFLSPQRHVDARAKHDASTPAADIPAKQTTLSTNPFDDACLKTTKAEETKASSSNPFDNTTQQSSKPKTRQFDSSNPFDDEPNDASHPAKSVDRSNPFDDDDTQPTATKMVANENAHAKNSSVASKPKPFTGAASTAFSGSKSFTSSFLSQKASEDQTTLNAFQRRLFKADASRLSQSKPTGKLEAHEPQELSQSLTIHPAISSNPFDDGDTAKPSQCTNASVNSSNPFDNAPDTASTETARHVASSNPFDDDDDDDCNTAGDDSKKSEPPSTEKLQSSNPFDSPLGGNATPSPEKGTDTSALEKGQITVSPTLEHQFVPVIWERDGEVSKCRCCGTSFSTFKRKHHCRSCGRIFCEKCTNFSISLKDLGFVEDQRVCFDCFHVRREHPPCSEASTFFPLHPVEMVASPMCAVCKKKKWQLLNCHACGHSVCPSCCQNLSPLPHLGWYAPVSVCDSCVAAFKECSKTNPPRKSRWVSDEQATHCAECGCEFGLTVRKHHCRECGMVFCESCSSHRYAFCAGAEPMRVCDVCYRNLISPPPCSQSQQASPQKPVSIPTSSALAAGSASQNPSWIPASSLPPQVIGNSARKVVWMQDSEAKACLICGEPFSATVRRHHCRFCGKLFCNNVFFFPFPFFSFLSFSFFLFLFLFFFFFFLSFFFFSFSFFKYK